MTASEDRPVTAGSRPGRAARLAIWAGHYHLFFLTAAVLTTIASAAAASRAGWLDDLTDAAMLAWVVAICCDLLRHQGQLCARCIAQAPVLNPQAAVDRWRWALRWEHHEVLRLLPPVFLIFWIIGSTAAEITTRDTRLWREPWQLAGYATLITLVGVIWVVSVQHRRLRPWCPYCRWGQEPPGWRR
jgi:hypothetical protein